ncbi:hypothetical protein ABW19_dt0206479 [Dactylella cylindrospora]|nr:hypothetical protein ABW19_dt0206479 [Dactylella cylindrospora]
MNTAAETEPTEETNYPEAPAPNPNEGIDNSMNTDTTGEVTALPQDDIYTSLMPVEPTYDVTPTDQVIYETEAPMDMGTLYDIPIAPTSVAAGASEYNQAYPTAENMHPAPNAMGPAPNGAVGTPCDKHPGAMMIYTQAAPILMETSPPQMENPPFVSQPPVPAYERYQVQGGQGFAPAVLTITVTLPPQVQLEIHTPIPHPPPPQKTCGCKTTMNEYSQTVKVIQHCPDTASTQPVQSPVVQIAPEQVSSQPQGDVHTFTSGGTVYIAMPQGSLGGSAVMPAATAHTGMPDFNNEMVPSPHPEPREPDATEMQGRIELTMTDAYTGQEPTAANADGGVINTPVAMQTEIEEPSPPPYPTDEASPELYPSETEDPYPAASDEMAEEYPADTEYPYEEPTAAPTMPSSMGYIDELITTLITSTRRRISATEYPAETPAEIPGHIKTSITGDTEAGETIAEEYVEQTMPATSDELEPTRTAKGEPKPKVTPPSDGEGEPALTTSRMPKSTSGSEDEEGGEEEGTEEQPEETTVPYWTKTTMPTGYGTMAPSTPKTSSSSSAEDGMYQPDTYTSPTADATTSSAQETPKTVATANLRARHASPQLAPSEAVEEPYAEATETLIEYPEETGSVSDDQYIESAAVTDSLPEESLTAAAAATSTPSVPFAQVSALPGSYDLAKIGRRARMVNETVGLGCTFNPGPITEAGLESVKKTFLKASLVGSADGGSTGGTGYATGEYGSGGIVKRQAGGDEQMPPGVQSSSVWGHSDYMVIYESAIAKCLILCKEEKRSATQSTPKLATALTRETDFTCDENTRRYDTVVYDFGSPEEADEPIVLPTSDSTYSSSDNTAYESSDTYA